MTLLSFAADHPARPRQVDLLTADHPYRPQPPIHRWRYASWLRAIVFMVVAALVVVALFALGWIEPVARLGDRYPWIVVLFELIAAVVAYAVLLRMEHRSRPVELDPARWRGLLWGLALGVVLCSVVIGLLALSGSYRVTGIDARYWVVPDLVSAGFTAAIAEEIMFRGVLFRLLEEAVGTWGGVIGSSLVFGLAHLSNPEASLWGALAIALEAGLLFAALYAVTRSLWWTMGLHFAWNMMQGPLYGSAVSGSGPADGWLTARFSGPSWWTGGAFGIEGSVITVVLLTAIGVALLVVIARNNLAVPPAWTRRRVLRSRPEAPDVPAQGSPTSEVPVPDVPTSEIPVPGLPTPEVLTPDLPTSEVPAPDAPTPDLPIPDVPTPGDGPTQRKA